MNEGYIGINLTRINVVSITDYHTIKRIARILLDVMTHGYICTIVILAPLLPLSVGHYIFGASVICGARHDIIVLNPLVVAAIS